jgi:hypothetical protein
MKMSSPFGLLFPARRSQSNDPDLAPLRDDQLGHPLAHDIGDSHIVLDRTTPDTSPIGSHTQIAVTAEPPTAMPREAAPVANLAAAKPVVGRPHMTAPELALLDRTMKSGFTRYLEFGAGGSTLLAVQSGIDTVVSVESDRAWCETIRHHPEIAPRIRAGRAAILHADIGPTKAFGAPVDSASLDRWPSYIRLPWVEWHRRGAMPDFVFVDGRFRVAACLSVIVAWHLSPRHAPFPLIAIHDVTPQRRSYQRLFTVFDSIENAETLHLLRLRQDADPLAVFTTLLGVQFDPS